MITFKACPRCRGDLYRDQDKYGEFDSCLQCGAAVDTVDDRVSVATPRGDQGMAATRAYVERAAVGVG